MSDDLTQRIAEPDYLNIISHVERLASVLGLRQEVRVKDGVLSLTVFYTPNRFAQVRLLLDVMYTEVPHERIARNLVRYWLNEWMESPHANNR